MSAQQISQEIGVPYLRVEVSNAPFVEAADNFLSKREAIDAALVFETEAELDQSLYFIIGNYELRILVLSLDDTSRDPYERLKKLRPIPTAFVGMYEYENNLSYHHIVFFILASDQSTVERDFKPEEGFLC